MWNAVVGIDTNKKELYHLSLRHRLILILNYVARQYHSFVSKYILKRQWLGKTMINLMQCYSCHPSELSQYDFYVSMFPCRQVNSQSTKICWCRSSEGACKCKTLLPKGYPLTCLIIVGSMDILKLTVQLLQAEFQPFSETKIQFIALGYQESASMWNGWNIYKREFWLRLASILCGPRSKGTLCLSRTSRRGCRILNSILQQTGHLLPRPSTLQVRLYLHLWWKGVLLLQHNLPQAHICIVWLHTEFRLWDKPKPTIRNPTIKHWGCNLYIV